MDFQTILLIGLVNLFVTFSFTMTGGMGLVLRPIMMFLGVGAQITIATARISSILGDIVSLSILNKSKRIDWRLSLILSPIYVLGGVIGIFVVTSMKETVLKQVIGVLLIFAGIFFIVKKKVGVEKVDAKFKELHYLISFPLLLIFGVLAVVVGGTGPLNRLLFILGYGKTNIEASAIQKAISVWQTLIAAIIFIYLALVDYYLLIALIVSGAVGTYLGTKLVLKKGENYLRVLLIVTIFASALKLIFF